LPPSSPSNRVVALALGLWVGALGSGFTILLKYKSTPGPIDDGRPRGWPVDSRLPKPDQRAALVMFAHPHCPCTRASISELAHLMGSLPDRMTAYVLFLRPSEASAEWDRTDLWRSAASIPGVTVVLDHDGVEARRFHALTSGLTLVYDREGRLLFEGGITPSRGHEGNSFGRQRIISLLTTGNADRTDSPVFGCALGSGHLEGAKSLEDES
jgi:hypothetical protein